MKIRRKRSTKMAELPVKEWIVLMHVEYSSHKLVRATTEEEARRKAQAGDFENCEGSEERIINWQVAGKPKVSE